MNNSNLTLPNVIDDVNGAENITNLWRNHALSAV